jgi:hypothetical protein
MVQFVGAVNRMPPAGVRVMVIPFADNEQFTTSGGTSFEYFELSSLEPLRYFGPWISSITAHTRVNSIAANTEWKIVFFWSVDGKNWTGPTDLFAAQSTSGNVIQTPYTTRTTFGLQMRYAVGLRVTTGTASASLNVTGSLAIEFVT